jgi:hypothetical protein
MRFTQKPQTDPKFSDAALIGILLEMEFTLSKSNGVFLITSAGTVQRYLPMVYWRQTQLLFKFSSTAQ